MMPLCMQVLHWCAARSARLLSVANLPPPCLPPACACQVDLTALQERLLRTECQLVDFGNAMRLDGERLTNEIQTRPYRAPEVRPEPCQLSCWGCRVSAVCCVCGWRASASCSDKAVALAAAPPSLFWPCAIKRCKITLAAALPDLAGHLGGRLWPPSRHLEPGLPRL